LPSDSLDRPIGAGPQRARVKIQAKAADKPQEQPSGTAVNDFEQRRAVSAPRHALCIAPLSSGTTAAAQYARAFD
jgi:hypothetical protein